MTENNNIENNQSDSGANVLLIKKPQEMILL